MSDCERYVYSFYATMIFISFFVMFIVLLTINLCKISIKLLQNLRAFSFVKLNDRVVIIDCSTLQ